MYMTVCVRSSIDATSEAFNPGRLVNHCHCTNKNVRPRRVELANRPYIVLEATRAIQAGEEILYDYGDYSKDARDNFSFFKDCK